jgi:protease PrsW
MFFFAWLVYWTDRFEKEPKILLFGAFLWGALIAAGGAFLINTILGIGVYLFTESETATNLATGSIIAPLIEESLKGVAVLLIFLLFRHEFDSILDGIVYAAITAIGFAATENTYYIFNGYSENGLSGGLFLVFIRVILVGWQHPFYTAFIGIGLAVARLSRRKTIRIAAPILGWSTAVFTHAVHNTLAQVFTNVGGIVLGTLIDWSGWLLMLVFILWAIHRESKWIAKYLQDEVNQGVISQYQYRIACSTWSQNSARINALFSGQYRSTRHFYQICAELAYKKHQLETLGEESGNSNRIQLLRNELAALAQQTTR